MTDDKPIPRLSPSIAHILINESPLHAWQEHYLLGGGRERDESEAQARGRILDRLIFGTGPELVVIDAENFRTKAAQELRDAATEARKIPVLASKIKAFEETANILTDKMARKGVELVGVSQARLEWESNGVQCKGKLDHFITGEAMIWDLKTCRSAKPAAIAASLESHGGYVQHAAYVEGVEATNPDLAGRVRMGFVFCEYVKPYAVTVAFLDGTLAQLGRMQWARAKEAWGRGLASGNWPEYSDGPVTIEAKPWQMTDAIESSPDISF